MVLILQTVTHSFEEVFDYGLPSDPATANAAPTRGTLDVLARVAEAAFVRFLEMAAPPPQVTPRHRRGGPHLLKPVLGSSECAVEEVAGRSLSQHRIINLGCGQSELPSRSPPTLSTAGPAV